MKKSLALLGAASVLLAVTGTEAGAQQTLAQVKQRGALNCQVGLPTPGFYALAADGTWSGMDVDVCRAVAAAIFNDPNKVRYQSVTSAVRFTSLANGESDMLSRTTTWTAVRDTQLGLEFAGVNFYDGQGFLVPRASGIKSAKELDGATVCVLTGTTTGLNLADYFRANNIRYQEVNFGKLDEVLKAYDGGQCDVLTADVSQLYALRLRLTSRVGRSRSGTSWSVRSMGERCGRAGHAVAWTSHSRRTLASRSSSNGRGTSPTVAGFGPARVARRCISCRG